MLVLGFVGCCYSAAAGCCCAIGGASEHVATEAIVGEQRVVDAMRLLAVDAETRGHTLHVQGARLDESQLSVEPGVARLCHQREHVDAHVVDLHALDGHHSIERERHAAVGSGGASCHHKLAYVVEDNAGGCLDRAHAGLGDELAAAQHRRPKAAAALERNDGVATRAIERHALEQRNSAQRALRVVVSAKRTPLLVVVVVCVAAAVRVDVQELTQGLMDVEEGDELVAVGEQIGAVGRVGGSETLRQSDAEEGQVALELAELGAVRVVLEALAVVGEEDQQCVAQVAARVQSTHHLRQPRVKVHRHREETII